MILHIVNKSPYCNPALSHCLNAAADNDAILLLEDAVLGISTLDMVPASIQIYALAPHMEARGIQCPDNVAAQVIDYNSFVDLVAQASKSISWF